jgi:hypothetical protein
MRLLLTALLAVVCACSTSWKRLEFKGGELYYWGVTPSKAQRLGEYLVKTGFFDGSKKSVQLKQDNKTYHVRIIVEKGLENDSEIIHLTELAARDYSRNVFEGSPVDIHLCNDHWSTIRVVIPRD